MRTSTIAAFLHGLSEFYHTRWQGTAVSWCLLAKATVHCNMLHGANSGFAVLSGPGPGASLSQRFLAVSFVVREFLYQISPAMIQYRANTFQCFADSNLPRRVSCLN